jgi:hypothetical protein
MPNEKQAIRNIRKVLRVLTPARHTGSVAPRPQPQSPEGRTIPSLPNEIWWIILEMVIYPGLIVTADYLPFQIEAVCAGFFDETFGSQIGAQKMMVRTKGNLKGVCRTWKGMIESTKMGELRVFDSDALFFDPHTRVNTSHCSRLNRKNYSHPGDSLVRFAYTHSISTLSFRVAIPSTRLHMKSLSDIISFPDELRALYLSLGSCKVSDHLLKDVETLSIPLTTLCLSASNPKILRTSLAIPTLVSLFISTSPYNKQEWKDDLSKFRWTLPALRNLALITGHSRSEPTFKISSSTHPFFLELLKENIPRIHSLLILPMTTQVFQDDSPLCWKSMPNLQALTTNFIDSCGMRYGRKKVQSRIVKSESVRHLVQTHLDSCSIGEVAIELLYYVISCNQLESITFVGSPGLYDIPSNCGGNKEMLQLATVCNARDINLRVENRKRTYSLQSFR